MKKSNLILSISIIASILISSCSSVSLTQMRYTRGLNLDLFATKGKTEENKAKKAEKKQNSIVAKQVGATNNDLTISEIEPTFNSMQSKVEILEKIVIKKEAIPNVKSTKINKAEIKNFAKSNKKELKFLVNKNKAEKTNKKAENVKPKSTNASGKTQLIALILVILVGVIGVHRFYLGYTWQGVVQLLTLGGCGVWALIDLIRIAIGDLKPKDGEYSETL